MRRKLRPGNSVRRHISAVFGILREVTKVAGNDSWDLNVAVCVKRLLMSGQ